MARYIDADKFIKDLQSEYHGMISDESLKIYKIIHRLDNEPTADVVEVKHGKWVAYPHNSGIYCSECRHKRRYKDMNDKFCPNCGAKME